MPTPALETKQTKNTQTKTYRYEDLPRLVALQAGDEKHDDVATSTLDVIWVLYDRVMRWQEKSEERDRFFLSKGHGPQAYFAVLAATGHFPAEWLATFGEYESPFGHHPDRQRVPGVEISSGSLGHGLAMALGACLGLRLHGSAARVFCLVGDGELDEGSNHEAIQAAGRLGVDNLVAVVVDNQSSSHGWPGGVERRFEMEGWATRRVDGRDHDELEEALSAASEGRPRVVVAEVEAKW
jgi:transketolase